ncbi:MAG: glycosyltransferase family 39 protein [Labilithrix sp.]|nr:glycosyltransferase family 39 protein [Labilithrix sp.]
MTRRDGLVVFAVALLARLALAAWAAGAIPPTADGTYYHVVASRIAEGHGYTWLWPDGAVTYAAHYPVGYPAIVAIAYAVFGTKPALAMIVNALFGAGAAWAAWDLLAQSPRKLALAAGLTVGLHPALVPYTAAIMTEGVTASLLILSVALGRRARVDPRRRWLAACGLVLGVATLVRPQSLVLAPVVGWLAASASASVKARAARAAAMLAVALAVCAPWTARNCARMDRCALVSVNGGWNLAIGAQTESGGWHEMKVPDECKEVFAEAAKDACFGSAALRVIARHPVAWLARAPAKLRATFDYFGAAPWYLHAANPERFTYRMKLALGAVETLASRLLLAAALVSVWRLDGPRSRARKIVCAIGLVACVLVPGTIGYLACAIAIAILGLRPIERAPILVPAASFVILATAATHAVFFGSGRYGLVVVPFVTALAFLRRDPARAVD